MPAVHRAPNQLRDAFQQQALVLLNLAPLDPAEFAALVPLVRDDGMVVSTTAWMPAPADETRNVRSTVVFVRSDAQQLAQLAALVDSGELRGDIAERVPLTGLTAIHERLAAIGDSHNPDDPYFNAFRARVLAQYGVARVEDLPVNYGGLLMQEGERLTAGLYDEFMRIDHARQREESAIVHAASLVSPVIALRRMSTAMAGTSLDHHARFLVEGERYRYGFVQALNGLHANVVTPQGAGDERIDKHHWQETPRFAYAPAAWSQVAARHAWPAFALLGGWLLALGIAGRLVAQRLERNPA